jgi:hypothetical protein
MSAAPQMSAAPSAGPPPLAGTVNMAPRGGAVLSQVHESTGQWRRRAAALSRAGPLAGRVQPAGKRRRALTKVLFRSEIPSSVGLGPGYGGVADSESAAATAQIIIKVESSNDSVILRRGRPAAIPARESCRSAGGHGH